MKGLYLPEFDKNKIFIIEEENSYAIKKALEEILNKNVEISITKQRYRLVGSKTWNPYFIYDVCGVFYG